MHRYVRVHKLYTHNNNSYNYFADEHLVTTYATQSECCTDRLVIHISHSELKLSYSRMKLYLCVCVCVCVCVYSCIYVISSY